METGIKYFSSKRYGNSATIEALASRPYKGAEKSQAYRLCCYAEYDNGMLYHCSVYETYEEAYNKLMTISCGEWKEGKYEHE